MRKPCIVKQLLTMQGFSIFGPAPGPPFLEFRPRGSRKETEFIGFAGSQARTAPAPGPPFLIFRPGGLRTKTEFIGFAGRRTQTPPAPGPAFLFWRLRGLRTKTDFIGSSLFSRGF